MSKLIMLECVSAENRFSLVLVSITLENTQNFMLCSITESALGVDGRYILIVGFARKNVVHICQLFYAYDFEMVLCFDDVSVAHRQGSRFWEALTRSKAVPLSG
ncbi:hypothetical protein [Methylomagnum sp.]